MPGRRKRRQSKKQSLVFTESPINNVKHVPSPVLCVDNPITAKQVPIDGDVSWVSPQFRDIRSAKREHRHLRKYHSTIVTRSRHPSNKENTTLHHKSAHYRDKYKSLKFLNDSSIDSVENISFSSPSPVRTSVPILDLKTPNIGENAWPKTWSLEKLKRSKMDFEISFSESLNVSTPNVPHHINHTLNIPIDTQASDQETQVISNKLPPCVESPDNCATPRRSLRLHAKQLLSCELFKTPPNNSWTNVQILVHDTPECDYSLSVRQRQLRTKQIIGNVT